MKSLQRSVISSGIMWITYALLGYFVLIRGVFLTRRLDYLVFRNDGKNLLFSIVYFSGLIVYTSNIYRKAILPLFEVFCRQKVEKTTLIDCAISENNGIFFPWTSITRLRISNEKVIFLFPDRLPDEIKKHKVRILFLRRSRLLLKVSIAE